MPTAPLHKQTFILTLQERPEYDQPIVAKASAKPSPARPYIEQLRNEYYITRELDGVDGVRPALNLVGTESSPILHLQYIQGHSLSEHIQRSSLDLLEKLRIAVEIAEIIGHIHQRQIVHHNISSHNIMIDNDGAVILIDFGLASSARQENQIIEGSSAWNMDTLAFASPELAGRPNRLVDYRTDFYSLGVTFYELFTSHIPFQSEDALGMIESHIARSPTPPFVIDEHIPLPVSQIILRLMAKYPEDRYQTAYGLQRDLQHCLDQHRTSGQIEPFALGQGDLGGAQPLSIAEEQIRSLFESAQVGVSLTTPDGEFRTVNKALLRMSGFTEQEVLARNVADFYVDPAQRDEVLQKLLVKGAVSNYGVQLKRKSGAPFYANLHVSRLERGGQEMRIALIDEVTEQVQLRKQLQQEVAGRKRAEAELQSQMKLIDTSLDLALETIEILDARTMGYLRWNKALNRISGYSDEEIASMDALTDLYFGEDLVDAERAVEEVFAKGKATAIVSLTTKDGRRIPMEYTGAITRDAQGDPELFFVIGRDISERVQTEERIRFQARLLESAQQAVIATDVSGRVIYWSLSAERLYGWSAEDAMGGMADEKMGIEDAWEDIVEIRAQFQAGDSWSGEFLARHRDGARFSIDSNLIPITDDGGKVTHVIGVSTDITKRVRARETLRASQELFHSSLDALSAHIAVLDTDGTILVVNGSWRDFARENGLAWPNYGVGRNYLASVEMGAEEENQHTDASVKGIREVMEGRRQRFQIAYPCHSPEEERWFLLRVTSFKGGNGLQVVVAHENISEQKQNELALQQSNRNLDRRLIELSTLNQIGQSLSTAATLRENFESSAAAIANLLDASQVTINLFNRDNTEITVFTSYDRRFAEAATDGKGQIEAGNAMADLEGVTYRSDGDDGDPFFRSLLEDYRAMVIPDPQDHSDPSLTRTRTLYQAINSQCLMFVPLKSQAKPYGLINFSTDQPGRVFTRYEMSLGEAVAGQIVNAIETAQLLEQMQQLSAAEERNRLARDLHDSVTQTLFSANIIADVLPDVWEQSPIRGQEGLEELRLLTKGALAEMRALLLELRPAALTEKPLGLLLNELATAVSSRNKIPISITIIHDELLLPDLQIALYRLTQEALTNVIKHAEADQVIITVNAKLSGGGIQIMDDGRGYDANFVQPARMGLQIMKERAQKNGIQLTIDSQLNEGTVVTAVWGDETE